MDAFILAVRRISQGCGVVSALLLLAAVLSVCHLVWVRYVLGGSAIWQHEFTTFALIGATFIGSPYVLLTRGHVNVDLLPHYLAYRARFVLALLALAVSLAFCLTLAWTGLALARCLGQQLAPPDRLGAAALGPLLRSAARHGPALAPARRRSRGAAHPARRAVRHGRGPAPVNELQLGALIGVVTILVLLTGAPVAFALGIVGLGFLVVFEGWGALVFAPDVFYGALDSFALLSISMFILMGGAVASSRAGADLYAALARWLYRVPGGLLASNIGACAIFAALSGSSPATCAAIGKMGIPEMRKRGYPLGIATVSIAAGGTLGILILPSITLIVYGIATETSIGRLFIGGLLPGLMLTVLFIAWGLYASRRHGLQFIDPDLRTTLRQKLQVLPKVGPFLLIIAGILYVLYGASPRPRKPRASARSSACCSWW